MNAMIVVLSLVPLGFLLYTLLNQRKLKISVAHPRVIVEFSIFLVLLILGIVL